MPTTPNYAFRYPPLSVSPNVPLDIQNLASDVDTALHAEAVARAALKPILVAKPTQVGFGTMTSGQTVTIAQYTIPDPGWAFHVKTEAMVDFGSGVSGTALQLSVNMDSTTYNTNAITLGHGTTFVANVNTDVNADCPMGHSKTMTPGGYTGGSHVLSLVAKAGAALTVYDGPSPGNGGDVYGWYIEIVPV